jgi:chlorite dismutase
MSAPPHTEAQRHTTVATAEVPPVPLTVEGAPTLHQIFRIKWTAWNHTPAERRAEAVAEFARVLAELEQHSSAAFSMLGHKGDLMLVHFRDSFDELNEIELTLARLDLAEFIEPVHSYVSVVELGLYESTDKVYSSLASRGIEPFSEQWNAEIADTLARQREAMRTRLFPEIPSSRYVCFYPMDRKRGEEKNWYQVPMAERKRMMREHGAVGRRYADSVKQIITGSIGLDDWEWGVTLFSDDMVVFKRLIYEMRFDEVSAAYALFGQFFVGIRVPSADLPGLLEGRVPK